jgi:hypothetical protein
MMTESRYLRPPEGNERANEMALAYDLESRRLRTMREQFDTLADALENADQLTPEVRRGMKALLDQQECILLELEDNTETLRANLSEMGVEVA